MAGSKPACFTGSLQNGYLQKLFLDIESIVAGTNFEESLYIAVDSCDVLLALIGNSWKSGPDGVPRIQRADDFVQREIARALTHGATVIPVLLDGAAMPSPGDLPPDLAELSYRQALPLRKESLLGDVARLSREQCRFLKREQPEVADERSSVLAEQIAGLQRSERVKR